MPAMTMAYRENDKAVLDQLKRGDKIRFEAVTFGFAGDGQQQNGPMIRGRDPALFLRV